MGIFSRVSDIITANLNALLDRAEDPEVLLAQVVREMEAGIATGRRSAAVAIAAERRLQREWDDHRAQADHWTGRARDALAAGREDLARRALARKHEHAALAESLAEQHADAAQTSRSARTFLRALEARLAEARRKQRALVARHRTARLRVEVHRDFGTGRAALGASLARFDRLEDQLTRTVDELTAEADLAGPPALETEFSDLDRDRAIEMELAALKGERAG
jgi:phage shock protein A